MATLGFKSPAAYSSARSVLNDAGYDDGTIKRHLKVDSIDEARKLGRTALMARTAGGTPLDTLIRVLLCGLEASSEAFTKAVAPMSADDWVRAGIVAPSLEGVRAALSLTPLEGRI